MAKRKLAQLPTPMPAYPTQPRVSGSSYRALARATDRYLAKAEEALRCASLIWEGIDAGRETTFYELAAEILKERHEAVEEIQELYGDRLGESAL